MPTVSLDAVASPPPIRNVEEARAGFDDDLALVARMREAATALNEAVQRSLAELHELGATLDAAMKAAQTAGLNVTLLHKEGPREAFSAQIGSNIGWGMSISYILPTIKLDIFRAVRIGSEDAPRAE